MTRLRTMLSATAISAALAFGLGGCTAPQVTLAENLHASVLQIAQRAGAEDFTGAMAELLLLERAVNAAVASGEIDDAGEAEIRAAIDLVRADLDLAATPTPTPVPQPPVQNNNDGNNGGGNDGDEGDNSGPGNSGNGNGGGNGGGD